MREDKLNIKYKRKAAASHVARFHVGFRLSGAHCVKAMFGEVADLRLGEGEGRGEGKFSF